ncbi:MAG: DUF3526 domain-containing protein [Holophagales bacterium]|nr:DUF3526 domain-containing protein [Holophagales bacterium]
MTQTPKPVEIPNSASATSSSPKSNPTPASPTPPSPSTSPIRIIARKELRETFRDGRFRVLATSVLLLLIVGLAAGWLETRGAQQEVESARAAEAATWLGQGAKNPHSAAHFGNYAFKPRTSLSALDRGVDSFLGTAVWLEAHWQDPFALRPAEDRTAVHRFGQLTTAFTLQVLAPLLVILLAFSAFAGEREHGTLRQLASLGLGARTLSLGKALGLGAALALILVPAVLLGAGATMLIRGGDAAGAGLAGTALWTGVYGIYFLILLALTLAVSARARSGRGALVVLLGFWMLTTLLVPRVVADLAERAHPIPTPRAFFAAIAEDEARGMEGQGTRAERRQALEERVLAEHGADSLDELPINFAGLSLQASEEHSNLVYDKHYGELWRLYEAQERMHIWAGLLSPTLAVRSLSMALAGTDIARHHHFAQAAESHRRVLVKALNDDMTENAGAASFGYLASEELWQRTPEFTYQPPALGEVLGRQAPAFAVLALWLAATVAGAVRATARLRVIPGEAA